MDVAPATRMSEKLANIGRQAVLAVQTQAWQIVDGVRMNVEQLDRTQNKDGQSENKLIIVMHDTATKKGVTALALCLRHLLRKNVVSSWNYIVEVNGDIYYYVSQLFNAWHAGESEIPSGPHKGQKSGWIRRHSIGIENVNPCDGKTLATQQQLISMVQLLRLIMKKHGIKKLIPGENFFMHRDLAPHRRSDAKSYTLKQLAALVNSQPEPPPGPHLGTYFVNVAVADGGAAKVRVAATRNSKQIGRRIRGEAVEVIEWIPNGDEVTPGNRWWAKIKGGGYVYGGLLSDKPIVKTAAAAAKTNSVAAVRSTADRMMTMLSIQPETITCGGLGSDDEDLAALLAQ